MNYLKEYNLTDDDIKDITSNIEEMDVIEIDAHEDTVRSIIEYLKSKNINNIKDIIMYKPHVFYASVDYIKEKLDSLDEETIKELREDINIFDEVL